MSRITKYNEMSEDELIKHWLKVFGQNVDKKLIEESAGPGGGAAAAGNRRVSDRYRL